MTAAVVTAGDVVSVAGWVLLAVAIAQGLYELGRIANGLAAVLAVLERREAREQVLFGSDEAER